MYHDQFNSATLEGMLAAPGTKFHFDHPTYGPWEFRFVKVASDTVVIAAGDLVHYKGATGMQLGVVTNDQSDAISRNGSAGIALVAVTTAQALLDNCYICILVRGYYPSCNVHADADVGKALISSTTDGRCDVVAAGTAPTYKVVGWATAVDATNVGPAEICLE